MHARIVPPPQEGTKVEVTFSIAEAKMLVESIREDIEWGSTRCPHTWEGLYLELTRNVGS